MTAFVITIIFYAFGMSITLGPTNIIMMSTGANHGFKNTIPFATGAAFGFTILVVIVALGFGELLTKHIVIMQTMTYIGSIMICFMGFKIAFSNSHINEKRTSQPSFFYGAVLQFLNPKSWIACMAGVSAFQISISGERLVIYLLIYVAIGYLCMLAWGFAGVKINKFLKVGQNLRIFNYIMGASLIVIGVYLAIMDQAI
ncbi:MAG: LysE family translocator [Emcibacteraceae bacterium]|jgi:threonine/homoserine/homoserine lactone efflux protein|tara:strand:- start:1559 stop:2158 length:600 start_codon:yes stop_codon:yes gene_type:complete